MEASSHSVVVLLFVACYTVVGLRTQLIRSFANAPIVWWCDGDAGVRPASPWGWGWAEQSTGTLGKTGFSLQSRDTHIHFILL